MASHKAKSGGLVMPDIEKLLAQAAKKEQKQKELKELNPFGTGLRVVPNDGGVKTTQISGAWRARQRSRPRRRSLTARTSACGRPSLHDQARRPAPAVASFTSTARSGGSS